MTHHFSIKEAIVFGWQKIRAHSALVFQVMLTMFALQIVSSISEKSLEGTMLGIAASIILAVAGVVLGAGMTLIFLRLAEGHAAHYRDIVPSVWLVWKYFCSSFVASILAMLPLMVGTLAVFAMLSTSGAVDFNQGVVISGHTEVLVVAGIVMVASLIGALYIALRLSMSRLAVLEGAEIVDSLRKSAKLTRGSMWHLALFVLVLAALNALGFLAFVVGLLLTVPISIIAYAHVYLKLKGHHGHH